jgi:hypothetical protein
MLAEADDPLVQPDILQINTKHLILSVEHCSIRFCALVLLVIGMLRIGSV